ncbi:uracil-DNA glycosylase [Cutibacterium acnes JCM 18909]|nr:uracil-DNA glycosylase [Cutibacterium acnes JCM 18909]
MVAHPIAELVTPDWAEALTGVEPRIHEMGDFLRAETAAGRGFFTPWRPYSACFLPPDG